MELGGNWEGLRELGRPQSQLRGPLLMASWGCYFQEVRRGKSVRGQRQMIAKRLDHGRRHLPASLGTALVLLAGKMCL